MTINKYIITLLLIFSCVSAHAESDYDTYKDWNYVVSLLRSKGIDAAKINWAAIEPACSIVKNTSIVAKYNQCRFTKALDQNQFESDSNYCNSQSKQRYFEYIKPSITTVTIRNAQGELISGTEVRKVEISKHEKDEFRNSAFVECMYNSGWSDPRSWLA